MIYLFAPELIGVVIVIALELNVMNPWRKS